MGKKSKNKIIMRVINSKGFKLLQFDFPMVCSRGSMRKGMKTHRF